MSESDFTVAQRDIVFGTFFGAFIAAQTFLFVDSVEKRIDRAAKLLYRNYRRSQVVNKIACDDFLAAVFYVARQNLSQFFRRKPEFPLRKLRQKQSEYCTA